MPLTAVLRFPIAEHCVYLAAQAVFLHSGRQCPPRLLELLFALLFHAQEFQRKGAARALVDFKFEALPATEALLGKVGSEGHIQEAVVRPASDPRLCSALTGPSTLCLMLSVPPLFQTTSAPSRTAVAF